MAREVVRPQVSARTAGVTVSWSTHGRHYNCAGINLSKKIVEAMKLPDDALMHVERCAETNRVWLRLVRPGEHGWRLNVRNRARGRMGADVRVPLPGIHGDKRAAQPCAWRLNDTTAGPELEIEMPAWAQPPALRRARLENVA